MQGKSRPTTRCSLTRLINDGSALNNSATFCSHRRPTCVWHITRPSTHPPPPLTHSSSISVLSMEDMHFSGLVFLQMKGMAVLGQAQQNNAVEEAEEAAESGLRVEGISKDSSIAELRRTICQGVLLECVAMHCLIGMIPMAGSCIVSGLESEGIMRVLAFGAAWNRVVQCLSNCQVMFWMRMSQQLALFEIRRVQCDIRVCPAALIHRVTPRFKALL